MLENEYATNKSVFSFFKVYFWVLFLVSLLAAAAFGVFKDGKGSGLQIFGLLTLFGVGAYVYVLLKLGVSLKALQVYLNNLASGDAVQALEAGRRYYSIKRKGLTGADGSGLTIYDEQAIQNDLTSFMHGGTSSIDYNAAENPFTPTKMVIATCCSVVLIGITYFLSPKSHAESLGSDSTSADGYYASQDQPVAQTDTFRIDAYQQDQRQLVSTQKQPALASDSVEQNLITSSTTEQAVIASEEAPISNEQNADIVGTWIGTLGDKPFVLHVDETIGGKLTGWNKTGNNKRPVTGSVKEFTEQGSNVKYELILNEPGSDKWDGSFTLTLTAPMANAAPTELMGEWKSFNGKLTKDVEASKAVE
ncbi:hypothetical protein LRS06_11415 [Hymenobacter sp. J193]|uniref:hypothetical protein n=1 Tax=Hymenobacter sp. J193 TaxID=2898429 RepID=UPI002151BA7A|nr:hypothetical protein [Hymenobacter sp. J193]MCR5888361.1 hypothetical protein [Hymenobacter sp. J193]